MFVVGGGSPRKIHDRFLLIVHPLAQPLRYAVEVAVVLVPSLGNITDADWVPGRHKHAPKLALAAFCPPRLPFLRRERQQLRSSLILIANWLRRAP